jgi:hypothetical protein
LNENRQICSLAAIAFHHEFDGALDELTDLSASIHWYFAEIHVWLLSPQPSLERDNWKQKKMRFPKLPCYLTKRTEDPLPEGAKARIGLGHPR